MQVTRLTCAILAGVRDRPLPFGAAWKAGNETMRRIRTGWTGARLLALNIARAWRWHLLRFRLVTFGLYEPHPWYGRRVFTHPWWQVNPRVAWLLLRRARSYSRWLAEMEAPARQDQPGWWRQQAGPVGYERLRAWIDAENAQ
jgi:hypothetical protein